MNKIIPTHSRVVRELVLIEEPDLPFALTDKGTVKEKITIESYAKRIEEAYDSLSTIQQTEVLLPDDFNQKTITKFIKETVRTFLPDAEAKDHEDLFEHGKYYLPSCSLIHRSLNDIFNRDGFPLGCPSSRKHFQSSEESRSTEIGAKEHRI